MITKMTLKNFKKIKEASIDFNQFDLLVGINNSGKSTILQALAIWQYCVDMFQNTKKRGTNGIQVVLPNFTALPLPEFNLLWRNKQDRYNNEKGTPEYILIEIDVFWISGNETKNFCVQMRYQSPQAVYAIPKNGWKNFNDIKTDENFPSIVYVPPFSGLEPHEKWMDVGNVRQNIGKAQPGSVLRNLLFGVVDKDNKETFAEKNWHEIVTKISEWFDVTLQKPDYLKGIATEITVEYQGKDKKKYDIISGGSGFHQILTILAFMHGYKKMTTILFDEPDAHLHINLQKQIINYFKEHKKIQFVIASHSEEFIKSAEITNILSLLSGEPKRISARPEDIINAHSIITNIDIIQVQNSPFILYVEGEDDRRIIGEWATILGKQGILEKFYIYPLCGESKEAMQKKAKDHYNALKTFAPALKQALLFDYDNEQTAINPPANQTTLNEWKRKNIDNYLLVSSAWIRAVSLAIENIEDGLGLYGKPYMNIVENFFSQQGLILPAGSKWKTLEAEAFKAVDGKKLLFENQNSLFQLILNHDPEKQVMINRTAVARAMKKEEIHQDIELFFAHLQEIVEAP